MVNLPANFSLFMDPFFSPMSSTPFLKAVLMSFPVPSPFWISVSRAIVCSPCTHVEDWWWRTDRGVGGTGGETTLGELLFFAVFNIQKYIFVNEVEILRSYWTHLKSHKSHSNTSNRNKNFRGISYIPFPFIALYTYAVRRLLLNLRMNERPNKSLLPINI